jgi:hypothetical protein
MGGVSAFGLLARRNWAEMGWDEERGWTRTRPRFVT